MTRYTLNLPQLNLVSKLDLVGGFEWSPEAEHLVDDTAGRPNIAFLIVALLLDLLRAHIVRSAHMGVCKDTFIAHDPGQAEIAQFYVLICIKHHVTGLQVTMKDFVAFFAHVALKKCKCELGYYFPGCLLGHVARHVLVPAVTQLFLPLSDQ